MSMKVFDRIVAEYASVGGGPISLTPMVGEIFLDKLLPEQRLLRSTPEIRTIQQPPMRRWRALHELLFVASCGSLGRILVSVYGLDRDEYRACARWPTSDGRATGPDRRARDAWDGQRRPAPAENRANEEVAAWASDVARRARGGGRVAMCTTEHPNPSTGTISTFRSRCRMTQNGRRRTGIRNSAWRRSSPSRLWSTAPSHSAIAPTTKVIPVSCLGTSMTRRSCLLSSDRIKKLSALGPAWRPRSVPGLQLPPPVKSARKIKWLLDDPNRYLGA